MFMLPYVPDDEHVEGTSGFSQVPSPMIPGTGLSDITTGLENMSLHGLQQPIQPIGTSMAPSTLPFNSPGHGPQWHMVPWGYTHYTPQVAPVSYQNVLSHGPSTPANSSSNLAMMSPMSSNTLSMTPFSSRQSSGSVMAMHHEFSSPRPSQGLYRADGRRQNATRINRGYFNPPGPHHNHVDIQKIKEGTDVRTTVS